MANWPRAGKPGGTRHVRVGYMTPSGIGGNQEAW